VVLDFELNDITSLPNTPEKQRRTGSMRPLLEQALGRAGDYESVRIPAADQAHGFRADRHGPTQSQQTV